MPGATAPNLPLPKGMSVAALVLGAISLVCAGLVTGIPAILLGLKARNLCHQGRYEGKDWATAGLVMGIFGTILTSICLILAATSAIPSPFQAR